MHLLPRAQIFCWKLLSQKGITMICFDVSVGRCKPEFVWCVYSIQISEIVAVVANRL